jgi:hypothetical protein
VLYPQELDIVIPQYNIAIEFCGLYWHSDAHNRMSNNYHLNKQQRCKDLGIRLITIFEDEWLHKNEIVKNILRYVLNKHNAAIYARKCEIVTIPDTPTKKQFFDTYHLQGDGRGSITYALRHDGIIVAMMTFIKLKNGVYELNRYATSHTNVVGGFSKLLKYFCTHNSSWVKIISYADRRWSDGNVYFVNNFKLTNVSRPSYYYVIQNKRFHRRGFMKHLLPKKLQNFDPLLTERENCDNNGINRIWDCGQLRFEMTK